MIVERHYDDETLIGLLGSSLDVLRDPHLAACNSCSESLDSYRAIAEVLGEDAAWDLRGLRQEPVPETMASLRIVAGALAAEEEAARAAVAQLLAEPESTWQASVSGSPALQTPSAVNALVGASEIVIDRAPMEAIAIVALAVKVALTLSPEAHPKDAVARAAGNAWRQFAYASFYVGDFPAASDAVARSQQAFESCAVSDHDLARLSIVRGVIFTAEERHDEARAEARHAGSVFEAFGDRQRTASAMAAEAFSFIHQLRYVEAMAILKAIERDYSTDIDNEARAGLVGNLAICYSQLGQVAEAFDHYAIAAAILDEIGSAPEAARLRYNVGCMLALAGRLSDAKLRFRASRAEFRKLGMAHMAVIVDLDLAELLLLENAHGEAEALCAAAVDQFQRTGLSATTRGLTALTFLQEAAAQRRATPQAARNVRKYLERLPREPELLFAPPPL